MNDRFSCLGLSYSRVTAINGEELDIATIESFTKRRANRNWRAGEIGCSLSHMMCWRKLVASDADFAAVFEDDTYLSSSLHELLCNLDWIPADADIVRLETTLSVIELGTPGIPVLAKHQLHRLLGKDHGTGGYIISRRAAERLAKAEERVLSTIDSALFNPAHWPGKELIIYQIDPAVVMQQVIHDTKVRGMPYRSGIVSTDYVPMDRLVLKFNKLKRELSRPYHQALTISKRSVRLFSGKSKTAIISYLE